MPATRVSNPKQDKEWAVKLPVLHDGHRYVLAHKRRHNVICAHRGWPKSTFLTRIALEYLARDVPVGWYAATSNHLLDNWEQHWSRALTKEGLAACRHKNDQTITLPGGQTCYFFSMEIPSNATGPTFPVLLCDECGAWQDGAFESAIEPIATKALAAFGWVEIWRVGTPNRDGNPYNDFWHALQLGMSGADPNIIGHRIPAPARVTPEGDLVPEKSPLASPLMTFDMLASSWRGTRRKALWQTEYLCQFLSDEGAQFEAESVRAACVLPCQTVPPKEHGWYQSGVDVGLRHDYTVMGTIDVRSGRLVAYERFRPESWPALERAIARRAKAYPGRMVVDCTGLGDRLPESMRALGVIIEPMVWSVATKPAALDHHAWLLDQGAITLWNDPQILLEYTTMRREARASGGWTIAAPKGGLDDIPMAFALMTLGMAPPNVTADAPVLLESLLAQAQQEARVQSFFTDPNW